MEYLRTVKKCEPCSWPLPTHPFTFLVNQERPVPELEGQFALHAQILGLHAKRDCERSGLYNMDTHPLAQQLAIFSVCGLKFGLEVGTQVHAKTQL